MKEDYHVPAFALFEMASIHMKKPEVCLAFIEVKVKWQIEYILCGASEAKHHIGSLCPSSICLSSLKE